MEEKVNSKQFDAPMTDMDIDLTSLLEVTKDFVSIDPGIPSSARHRCGEARLGQIIGGLDIKPTERVRLTEACYTATPGVELTLTISFYADGQPVKPKGMLQLKTTRGKLDPTRVELNSRQKEIKIKYLAPDETIKVSIRAFLEGFYRGKIHLHLE